MYVCICMLYIYVCRSRHAKKMLNYLDDIEPDSSASYVKEMATATGSDEDTGFGTDNTQTTTTTTIGSELFGGIFNTAIGHKVAEVAVTNAFDLQQQKQQHHYQQQQHQQFHYPGLLLQLQQERGAGPAGGGRGGKHLKRKKLEYNQVELNNDDACSEDEFIRKIATVTADSQEASSDGDNGSKTRIISVETLSNNNKNNGSNISEPK